VKLSNRAQGALLTGTRLGGYTEMYTAKDAPHIVALTAFAAQNPGLDFRDYGDGPAYRSDSRSITKDWKRYAEALHAAYLAEVKDADVIEAATRAFSGRVSFVKRGKGIAVDYCTGQYWPTEYRAAAASVLEYATRMKETAHAKANPPAPVAKFSTIAEIREQNKASGYHWFDKDTMRFFGCRIVSDVIGGRYFLTSEQPPQGPRAYSIREAGPDGDIETVGEFCSYKSKGAARTALMARLKAAK
jgi:hypothetical protein